MDPNATLPDAPPDATPKGTSTSKRNGRRELPKHLPREDVRLVPTATQLAGKGCMHKISETSSDVLEYTPAQFKVILYIRETWANSSGDMRAALVLLFVEKLYKIEEASRLAEDSHDQRLTRRLAESSAILDELESWIALHKPTEPPRTHIGIVLTCADNHWKLLARH